MVKVFDKSTHVGQLELELLQQPGIRECAIRFRTTSSCSSKVTAFLVVDENFESQQFSIDLHARQELSGISSTFVLLHSLPLADSGCLDESRLAEIPVVDDGLALKCQEKLKQLTKVREVSVVKSQARQDDHLLHISDLFPPDTAFPGHETTDSHLKRSGAIGTAVCSNTPVTPAICHGADLPVDLKIPQYLGQALQQAADGDSDRDITHIRADGSEYYQSYRELLAVSRSYAAALGDHGIMPARLVILLFDQSHEFIPAVWSCFIGGFIPVPLSVPHHFDDKDSTVKKLLNVAAQCDHSVVLTNSTIAARLKTLPGQWNQGGIDVIALGSLPEDQVLEKEYIPSTTDRVLLLATSGSTGNPKLVTHTHRSLLMRCAGTTLKNQFTQHDISLNWLPLDHVGGLVMFHLRDVFLKCRQIHAPTELVLQDPLRWLDWIDAHKATITWAPNFAFSLVNSKLKDARGRTWDLSSMRFILNGGEAIVSKTAREFVMNLGRFDLPQTAMHPAWGMSETASGITFSDEFSPADTGGSNTHVSVGKCIPGVSMRIVDPGARDRLLNENDIGILQVKGEPITTGYYENQEETAKVFTKDGWFDTGDLGYIANNNLTITGRLKDDIVVNGINYPNHEIEASVEEIPEVARSFTATCAVRSPGEVTDELAIFFSPSKDDDDSILTIIKSIRQKISADIGVHPRFVVPLRQVDLPKTQLGKIRRSKLVDDFYMGKFDDTIRKTDIGLKNQHTVPDWFYTRSWRRKDVYNTRKAGFKGKSVLVFVDNDGMCAELCMTLTDSGARVYRVLEGTEFKNSAGGNFTINPANKSHYQRVLAEIRSDGFSGPDVLVHLWTCLDMHTGVDTTDQLLTAQNISLMSLLHLVQSLADSHADDNAGTELYFVSRNVQSLLGGDNTQFKYAAVSGFLKTIPTELPWLLCRHIDLEDDLDTVNAGIVFQELHTLCREPEVVFRKQQRYSSVLNKIDIEKSRFAEPVIEPGGVYLITGGLGGIGVQLIRYLARQCGIRPIIVGTTVLPEREHWAEYLDRDDVVSDRIRNYIDIESACDSVIYLNVDPCNESAMRSAIEDVERKWHAKLSGILHLAGIYHTRTIVQEDSVGVEAMLKAKVLDTWCLSRILDNRPNSLFVLFSSIYGLLGSFGSSAYSAVNSFQDNFCQFLQANKNISSVCFFWSMWNEIGLSRNFANKSLITKRGYRLISHRQGIASFMAALRIKGIASIVVGLNAGSRQIGYLCSDVDLSVEGLTAYYTARDPDDYAIERDDIGVEDEFGCLSTCRLVLLENMPVLESGLIDRNRLEGDPEKSTYEGDSRPKTLAEKQLSNIYRDLFKVNSVSAHDNFFDLGGNSLQIIKLYDLIESYCGTRLQYSAIFESTTLRELARAVDQGMAKSHRSPLVPIQPFGSNPAIYLVHSGFGHALVYKMLADCMGENQPIYGLEAVGLGIGQTPSRSIYEMADSYINEIKTHQSKGPYILGGFSVGGTVAYEMAQRLHARGEHVVKLFIFDSVNLARVQTNEHTLPQFTGALHKYLAQLKTVPGKFRSSIRRQLSGKPKHTSGPVKIQAEYLKQSKRSMAVFRANKAAENAYIAKSYPGSLVYFRATKAKTGQVKSADPENNIWLELARGGAALHDIPCAHDEIVRQPHAQTVALLIQAHLEQK